MVAKRILILMKVDTYVSTTMYHKKFGVVWT
jgi:hypothetical protein